MVRTSWRSVSRSEYHISAFEIFQNSTYINSWIFFSQYRRGYCYHLPLHIFFLTSCPWRSNYGARSTTQIAKFSKRLQHHKAFAFSTSRHRRQSTRLTAVPLLSGPTHQRRLKPLISMNPGNLLFDVDPRHFNNSKPPSAPSSPKYLCSGDLMPSARCKIANILKIVILYQIVIYSSLPSQLHIN